MHAPRSKHHTVDPAAQDEWFGPGTDLMVSLFALIAVVLGFVAWQRTQMQHQNTKLKGELSDLKKSIPEPQPAGPDWPALLREAVTKNSTLTDEIEKLRVRLADLESRLSRESMARQQAESALASMTSERDRLRQQIAALQQELAALQSNKGDLDTRPVLAAQSRLVDEIASAIGLNREANYEGASLLRDHLGKTYVTIQSDAKNPLLQRFYFGSDLLFPSDEATITAKGGALLRAVASAIQRKLGGIVEIQIQGHADSTPSFNFDSNMELAYARGRQVFDIFRDQGISPTYNLMSVTSFGEYKPASRRSGDAFDDAALETANESDFRRERNRRVEVLLFYSGTH